MQYLKTLPPQELPNRWSISGAVLVAVAIFLKKAAIFLKKAACQKKSNEYDLLPEEK